MLSFFQSYCDSSRATADLLMEMCTFFQGRKNPTNAIEFSIVHVSTSGLWATVYKQRETSLVYFQRKQWNNCTEGSNQKWDLEQFAAMLRSPKPFFHFLYSIFLFIFSTITNNFIQCFLRKFERGKSNYYHWTMLVTQPGVRSSRS